MSLDRTRRRRPRPDRRPARRRRRRTARDLLDGLVYPRLDDPDELIPATTALSGNVRRKLAARDRGRRHQPRLPGLRRRAARGAARSTAKPRRSGPPRRTLDSDAESSPSSPRRPSRCHARHRRTHRRALGGRRRLPTTAHGRLMTETWGTAAASCDAVSLLEVVCNSKQPSVITDRRGRSLDVASHLRRASQGDQDHRGVQPVDLRRRGAPRHPGRRIQPTVQLPARTRATTAPPALPGLSDRFAPHPYQRNAVARIIAEPTILLDHVVGAGKIGHHVHGARWSCAASGWSASPGLWCPTTSLSRSGEEAKQWYPGGELLLGSAATTAEGRRRFDRPVRGQRLGHGDRAAVGVHRDRRVRTTSAPTTSTSSSTTLRTQLETRHQSTAPRRRSSGP